MASEYKAKFGAILLFALVFLPLFTQAETISNTDAGFVKGSIWYSEDPFAEGDKIKIYSFVFNPEDRELKGTVIFFDKTVFLGKVDFVAPVRGVKNVSIDWTVNAGDHEIFAKIENSKFLKKDGTYEDVYLVGNETDKSKRTVQKTIVPVVKKEVAVGAQANSKDKVSTDTNLPSISVSKVVDTVVGITPDFIANPIVAGAYKLEDIRENISTSTITKKDEIKKEVEAFKNKIEIKKDTKTNSKTSPATNETKNNALQKPWKQVQLFFLTIFAFIFASKFLFYLFWIVLILLIIRFIRRQFFKK